MTHSEVIVNVSDLMQELMQEHNGKWVLLSEDKHRVLCSAMTIKHVLEDAACEEDDSRLLRVPGDPVNVLREL